MTRSRNINPSNAVTLLRLVLVPFYAVAQLEGRPLLAFTLFALASFSDLVDGWMARRFGWITPLGVFIDPMADKALQLTAFTLLVRAEVLPVWVGVISWSRELIVVSGFVLLALVARKRTVRSSWLGKLGTLAQMSSLSLLLAHGALGWPPALERPLQALLAGSVLLHFTGGLDYAWRGFQAYDRQEEGPSA